MAPQQKSRISWWYTGIIAVLLAGVTGLTMYHLFHEPQQMRSDYVADDVAHLAKIFNKINETCSIISFDRVHNYIDFLNVVEYKGSEVGPMNVRYPDGWQGPYMIDNPTIQGVAYMVLATQEGHYVVPGVGVTLSNGKTIGSDIVLDAETDLSPLLQDGGDLNHNGKQLAAPINVDG